MLAALAGCVTVLHLGLAELALPPQLGPGAAARVPPRIAVDFVHELAPAAPASLPPAAPRPARPARRPPLRRLAASVAIAPAASAAAEAPLAPVASEPAVALAPADSMVALAALAPQLAAASSAEASASAVLPAAASPADASFAWPPSTRLRYRLTGNYRGPVDGQASVEWRRAGSHYQVFMDLAIGPPFAPLITRHVASDGEITLDGLSPQRYDEDTRVVLREPRHLTVWLDPEQIRLADGRAVPRPAGVQDSASQFVQLTWLFTTRPALLQPGSSIVLPLALARQVQPWTYDVLASETLATPAGPVDAVHVKPRREPQAGRELTAELWVAPSLQYLPVRILIRQDAETYVDLNIDRLPEQAAAGR